MGKSKLAKYILDKFEGTNLFFYIVMAAIVLPFGYSIYQDRAEVWAAQAARAAAYVPMTVDEEDAMIARGEEAMANIMADLDPTFEAFDRAAAEREAKTKAEREARRLAERAEIKRREAVTTDRDGF